MIQVLTVNQDNGAHHKKHPPGDMAEGTIQRTGSKSISPYPLALPSVKRSEAASHAMA